MKIPPPAPSEDSEDTATPGEIPIETLLDDGVLFAINKQPKLAVQPRFENHMLNVLSALHARHRNEDPELDRVPHLAHRLDMDTSGVLLLLWDRKLAARTQQQFSGRSVRKEYLAIVHGVPDEDQGTVDVPIKSEPDAPGDRLKYYASSDGKEARTDWVVEEKFNNFALVRFKPYHGRTHQIRIHALYMGHPIICDHMHGGGDVMTKSQLITAETTSPLKLPIIGDSVRRKHDLVTSIDLHQISPPLAAARDKRLKLEQQAVKATTNPNEFAPSNTATSKTSTTSIDTKPAPAKQKPLLDRCALHSNVLELKNPSTAKTVLMTAPIAPDMLRVLEALREIQSL